MNRTRAFLPACQAQTGQFWAVRWLKKDSEGGVILLLGCLSAWWLPVCATSPSANSSCGDPEEQKGVPDGADGWPLGWKDVLRSNVSLSLFLPTSVSVSPSSVCEPCCDHCSEKRKRLFVQDPVTCRCSCKHTDEHCKDRQLELNERTCKWVSARTRRRWQNDRSKNDRSQTQLRRL